MKILATPWRATQDRQVRVEISDKTWSTGEGNGKPLQYSCLENPMNGMKRQKYMIMKDELSRSVGTKYATGEEWRNNSRKNEVLESKQKQHPIVDVTGDGSKVQCCKEQYCMLLLLLLSRFSRVRLCATPQTAGHQALPSLGFSRQEHWSGLPFPPPMHESEKWKWSHSVVSNS